MMRKFGKSIYYWGDCNGSSELSEKTPRFEDNLGNIRSFQCGPGCCSVVLHSGEALCWGKNTGGRFGVCQNTKEDEIIPVETPKRIELSDDRRIVSICHSKGISLLLDDHGHVWGCGRSEEGVFLGGKTSTGKPEIIMSNEKGFPRIKKIGCSNGTVGFSCISDEGILYTWGNNHNWRLGYQKPGSVNRPKLVSFFSDNNLKVKDVRIGNKTSLFLDEDGKLYSNRIFDYFNNPTLVSYFNKIVVTQISVGEEHLACIDEDGSLYTWGSNELGQLGEEYGTETRFQPKKVSAFHGSGKFRISTKTHKFLQISCGSFHNIALLEERYEDSTEIFVLVWGSNKDQQLGIAPRRSVRRNYGFLGPRFGTLVASARSVVRCPRILDFFQENKCNILGVCAAGGVSGVVVYESPSIDFDMKERVVDLIPLLSIIDEKESGNKLVVSNSSLLKMFRFCECR